MNKAEMTLIVLCGKKAFGLERFYKSLIETQPVEKVEIIFVLYEGFNFDFPIDAPLVEIKKIYYKPEDFYNVIVKAIRDSNSDYIFFLENHSYLKVNVVDAYLRILKNEEFGCVGCTILPGDDSSFTDWVAYLDHYGCWGPGVKSSKSLKINPGHSSVYPKKVLLDLGDELETFLHFEVLLQWRLTEKKLSFYFSDEMFIVHDDKMSFVELFMENYYNGRILSQARRKTQNFGLLKRIFYSVAIFAKPLLRMHSLLKLNLDPIFFPRNRIWKYVPAVLLGYYSSAVGESLGMFFNSKKAIKKICEIH